MREIESSIQEDGASRSTNQDSTNDMVANPSELGVTDGNGQSNHEQFSGTEVICRPKVGYRVAGGGFLGIWKKMKH